MTVIKRFRSESKLEVLHTAQRLRRDITLLMLHDFGVRPKVRELQLETKGMSPEDGQMFLAIAEKYGISKADAEWPSWLIGKIRDSLFEILRQLVLHVTAANSIYPAEFADAELRRKHQDAAIACCAQLYQELEFSMSVLPVDITRYAPFLDEVDKETALIKGWRKSDNKFKRAFSDSASNFANVNNNGNANYNNASNSNGVRPDFDTVNNE